MSNKINNIIKEINFELNKYDWNIINNLNNLNNLEKNHLKKIIEINKKINKFNEIFDKKINQLNKLDDYLGKMINRLSTYQINKFGLKQIKRLFQ